MHLALLTYGTRGDVQPFIALAVRLQKEGHSVRLAAPEAYASLAAEYGVPYTALAGDPAQFARDLTDKVGGNLFKVIPVARQFVMPLATQVIGAVRMACEGADLILHSFLLTTGGHALARELNVPDISVQFFPAFAPTGEFPAPGFPHLPFGKLYNRFSHHLLKQIYWYGGHVGYDTLKKQSPAFPQKITWPFRASERRMTPRLYAFSPTLIPRPPDWGEGLYITGYWWLDRSPAWRPPHQLLDFLEAGPPPVCISFGSMVSQDAERVYRVVLAALAKSGQRGLILSEWEGWKALHVPPEVLVTGAVPHDWLLPHMAANIHHGGAGVTGAVLRAGPPSLVIPFGADQPFWAQRVAKLGVGPAPIAYNRLTVENLTAAIGQLLQNAEMRRCAAEIGQKIQAEDGLGNAMEIIDQSRLW
jgi:sterol 3beta-glucosyltransferase